jgi:hypothetical protein
MLKPLFAVIVIVATVFKDEITVLIIGFFLKNWQKINKSLNFIIQKAF